MLELGVTLGFLRAVAQRHEQKREMFTIETQKREKREKRMEKGLKLLNISKSLISYIFSKLYK